MTQRVVKLAEVKDILQSWEEVRQCLLKGGVRAFALTLQDQSGAEFVFYGGAYKTDPRAALRASLRQSWDITKVTGPKP